MSTIKTNKIKNVEENVNIENKDIKKLEEKIIFFEKNINDKMSADINLMHLSICNKLIIIEKQINDVVNKQIEQKERHNSFIYKCKEGFEETAKQQKELNVAMYNQTDKLRTLESKNIKQINNEEKVIEKATIIMSNKINTQLTEIKQILQKKHDDFIQNILKIKLKEFLKENNNEEIKKKEEEKELLLKEGIFDKLLYDKVKCLKPNQVIDIEKNYSFLSKKIKNKDKYIQIIPPSLYKKEEFFTNEDKELEQEYNDNLNRLNEEMLKQLFKKFESLEDNKHEDLFDKDYEID